MAIATVNSTIVLAVWDATVNACTNDPSVSAVEFAAGLLDAFDLIDTRVSAKVPHESPAYMTAEQVREAITASNAELLAHIKRSKRTGWFA